MKPKHSGAEADSPPGMDAETAFEDLIRRLVKGAAELRAIESGEIDAIIDPASGNAILLPAAQAALLEGEARLRARKLPKSGHAAAHQAPVANSLLAALPREHYQRLLAGLEPVTLTSGEVLYEPGQPIEHVYFPWDSLVSLLTLAEAHHSLEVGLVGREGMVGIPLALGADVSTLRALVQGTGTAMRMEAARFRREFLQSAPLQRELYRYAHALMAQVAQTAACNHYHRVEARLARWLLMTRDRAWSNELHLTHEFLAAMLGVQRVGITLAASALQERKLIRYSRGYIRILDRRGLEAASCLCYRKIKNLQF